MPLYRLVVKRNLLRSSLILGDRRLKYLLTFECSTFFFAFSRFFDFASPSVSLITQHLRASAFRLLLMDELHENSFVLEDVTLHLHVQRVVKMLINLLCLSVLLQESSEHPHPSNPEEFLRSSCIRGTLPLSVSAMTPFPTCFIVLSHTCSRVDCHRLADNQPILDQFADVLS